MNKDNVDVRSVSEREEEIYNLHFQSSTRGLPIPQPETKIYRNIRGQKNLISSNITPGNFILIVIILFTYITEKKHPFCSKYIIYIGKINIDTLNRFWLEQALSFRNIHRKGKERKEFMFIQNMRLNPFKANHAYWTSEICTCIF